MLTPPHTVLPDFLDEPGVAGLLSDVLTRAADFKPTGIGSSLVDPGIRKSHGLRDPGVSLAGLRSKVLGSLPRLTSALGLAPFEPSRLETELVAHGDGAFYKRHIDTQIAEQYEASEDIRLISCVYYFFVEPKAFSGGALRLYAIGGDPAQDFIDIAPARNSLLAFPSWAPHEVTPVRCPSGRFIDSRFSINCWVHRRKSSAPVRAEA